MLLEKALVIKTNLFTIIIKLIDREVELYEWGMYLLIFFVFFFFYSLFHFYCFCSLVYSYPCFLLFFFFFFSSSTLPSSILFFSFFSRQSVHLFVACLFLLVFFFYFFQFQHFSLSFSFIVVLWYLKLSFTVTRFILSPWKTLLAQAPNRDMLYHVLYSHPTASQRHNN